MELQPGTLPIAVPRSPRVALALAIAWAVAGCSGDNNPVKKVSTHDVKGQVLRPDGKPLGGGMIYFEPKPESAQAQPAQGPIGPDGTFTLNTGSSGPGAAAGEYKVYIKPDTASLPRATGKRGATVGQVKLPFPAEYSDPDTSGLVATVKAEPNQLPPFRLEANGPKMAARAQAGATRD